MNNVKPGCERGQADTDAVHRINESAAASDHEINVEDKTRSYVNVPVIEERINTALGPLLRERVGERLLAYMVQAIFVDIDEVPLSPMGRTDHTHLLGPMAEPQTRHSISC